MGLHSSLWFSNIANLAVYSNGWVNAAVYGWQNRHICSGVDWRRLSAGRHALPAGNSRSSLGQSFHVGFGRVSRFFPQTVSSEAVSEASKQTSESRARSMRSDAAVRSDVPKLGVLFEVRGGDELCINARIDSYMLLQGQMLSLRPDGMLYFFTRPIWLDVASVLGENWAVDMEGHASGVQIHLEYYSNFSPGGRPSLATKCVQLPLQPGLWLVSEASDRSSVSLVPMSELRSVHSEEVLTILSPSQSASSDSLQSSDFVQRRDFDSWAAFMGS
eukprot:symbB.v1.2.026685.t1/scaffold2603.1/size75102/5